MFKSKGFTITFIILAILILGLSFVLGYLLFSGKGNKLVQNVASRTSEAPATTTAPTSASEERTTTTEEDTTTEEPTTTEAPPDTSLRALKAEETHKYPVLGEDISEKGVLTIVRAGDDGEGLTFHKKPRFDAATASGNLVLYNGAFDTVAKIYIMNNGRPFLMYKTHDGYYVTSSDYYVSYKPDKAPATEKDVTKVVSYGYDEHKGAVITVHQDDGNTLAFSIYDYDNATSSTTPLLTDVIASYDADGVAHFEYHNTDGRTCEGTITFENPADSYVNKQITVRLESAVRFTVGEMSEITLHN